MSIFTWQTASIERKLWIAVSGLVVLMTLVVAATRRSPDDVDARSRQICTMIWVESVRRGAMPLHVRATGTVASSSPSTVRVVISLDAVEGPMARVGQSVEMDNTTHKAQGRVTDVFKDGDNGPTRVVATFGSDAPERHPGSEMTVKIDAGAIPSALYVGRPAFGLSNSTATLFRFKSGTGIAERVSVRLGRAVGSFAEIVDGLYEGDKVILSDMSAYEHARRVRFD
jgi:hypothetical protein